MSEFIYGVAENDITSPISDCPFYVKWFDMIRRSCSHDYKKRNPSYIGVTVCEEWLKFSNFKSWMKGCDWRDKELDKDLIHPHNKVYAPENCCFIPHSLNTFMIQGRASKRGLPKGVTYHIQHKKFQARISIDKSRVHLGYYNTVDEAHLAYRVVKIIELKRLRKLETDKRIRKGLKRHIKILEIGV